MFVMGLTGLPLAFRTGCYDRPVFCDKKPLQPVAFGALESLADKIAALQNQLQPLWAKLNCEEPLQGSVNWAIAEAPLNEPISCELWRTKTGNINFSPKLPSALSVLTLYCFDKTGQFEGKRVYGLDSHNPERGSTSKKTAARDMPEAEHHQVLEAILAVLAQNNLITKD